MDCEMDEEDLPLSVMEVDFSQPIHNESTPTSENGSQFGAEGGAVAGTGSGFSHCIPREGRERSRSAHTAVMEEDSYRNVHPSCNEKRTRMDLACDKRFSERFDDITKISQGSFGQVMKAREKKENEYYAVKIVPQRKADKKRLLREVAALELLRHQNIVRCYHFWWGMSKVNLLDESEESDSSSRRGRGPEFCLFIQMELCELSLHDWIWKRNEDTAETVKKDRSLQIFRQIIDGVKYIHSQMFIHRDLKPTNIFLTRDMLVKIGDFGLVTRVSWKDKSQKRRTHYIGTEDYMAPEQKEDNYESEVDIFPLGLILFELLWRFGSEMERAKTWKKIRSADFPTEFEADHPVEACEIREMLSREPQRRPSAEDLKKRF